MRSVVCELDHQICIGANGDGNLRKMGIFADFVMLCWNT
jgi:hypothetical protein